MPLWHDTQIHGAVGDIDPARLIRWNKLTVEECFNSSSLAERNSTEKPFQNMINTVQQKTEGQKDDP